MAVKGKGKGKGKTALKGSAPWMQKGEKELALKGRNLISDSRFVGCVSEWHGSWGWIEPLDSVSHPQIKKNKGRIYAHRTDARGYIKMEVGVQLDFQIYCDARGLGAVDCTQVEEAAVQAAAALAAAVDEAVLPEGWEKHWSAEHSEYFYWNRITKERSWLPPKVAEDGDDDDENPLPQAWSKHYDPENQEWYYWNKASKRASWQRPDAPAKGEAAEDKISQNEPPTKKSKLSDDMSSSAPVLGQQRVKGRIAEWHGFFGWIVPLQELTEDLRPLLEKGDDKIYLNWRDVEPGLEIEVNMEVDFMLYEDDNGLAASDVNLPGSKTSSNRQAGVAKKLASQWQEEDEADIGDAAEAAAASEDGDEENEGPLLPGWEQMWSDEHDCHYYWHKLTKTATWERPSLPLGDDDDEEQEDAEDDGKVWDGEGSESGAAHTATPMTPLVSHAGRQMTPVTPGASKAQKPILKPSQENTKAPTTVGRAKTSTPIKAWNPQRQQPQQQQPRRYLQAWER
jgi:hypothetical protein